MNRHPERLFQAFFDEGGREEMLWFAGEEDTGTYSFRRAYEAEYGLPFAEGRCVDIFSLCDVSDYENKTTYRIVLRKK